MISITLSLTHRSHSLDTKTERKSTKIKSIVIKPVALPNTRGD